jgi:hypothetical protein
LLKDVIVKVATTAAVAIKMLLVISCLLDLVWHSNEWGVRGLTGRAWMNNATNAKIEKVAS